MATIKIEMNSGDWFWITGRGAVATFDNRKWPFDPAQLNNQEVYIDNKRFRVRGVERWAMQWHVEAEWPLGLLVEPLDDAVSQRYGFYRSHPGRTYEQIVAQNT